MTVTSTVSAGTDTSTVSGGTLLIVEGTGVARGISVLSGGTVIAASDGFGTGQTIDLTGITTSGATQSFSAVTDVLTISGGGGLGAGGDIFVQQGGTLVEAPVDLILSSGHISSGLTLSGGIILTVLSGGTALSDTISSGGTESLVSGALTSGGITFSGNRPRLHRLQQWRHGVVQFRHGCADGHGRRQKPRAAALRLLHQHELHACLGRCLGDGYYGRVSW